MNATTKRTLPEIRLNYVEQGSILYPILNQTPCKVSRYGMLIAEFIRETDYKKYCHLVMTDKLYTTLEELQNRLELELKLKDSTDYMETLRREKTVLIDWLLSLTE